MKINPIHELDEKIAIIALWVINVSIYFAILENLFSHAPISLIYSNSVIASIMTGLVFTHSKWRKNKTLIRWFFIVFCYVIFPLVWLNSKGAMGAQSLYMAFFIVLATLILDYKWAGIISASTVGIVAALMLGEYFDLIRFSYTTPLKNLILSNLIHYIIVYVMLIAIGIAFKFNYSNFQREYYRLSVQDELTGLNNRRFLIKVLNQMVSETKRHQQPFSVLFIDIDNFKLVNDHDGHHVGDQVLILLGKIITGGLREYDIGGRYGGDEIMVLLPHTKLMDAKIISSRIENAFNEQVETITKQPVSLSIGIIENENKSTEEIIRSADEAMYLKKKR